MSDMVRVMGAVQSKSGVLSHPELFKDIPMIILRVHKDYLATLVEWSKEHDIREVEIEIREKPENATDRAKRFFFTMRDMLAFEQNGDKVTRKDKDHLYRSCIKELGLKDKEGKPIDSLKTLTTRELWIASELMHQWLVEAEMDTRSIEVEYKASQSGLREE